MDRQALHAELLGFRHPVTGDAVSASAPLPPDMEAALKALRLRHRLVRAEAGKQGEEGLFRPKITEERKLERIRKAKRYAPDQIPQEQPRGPSRRSPKNEDERPPRAGGQGPGRPRPGQPSRGPRPSGPRPARPSGSSQAGPRREGGPGSGRSGSGFKGSKDRPNRDAGPGRKPKPGPVGSKTRKPR
jgi:hypothetical protein